MNQTMIALPFLKPNSHERGFQAFWIRYSGAMISETEFKTLAPLLSDQVAGRSRRVVGGFPRPASPCPIPKPAESLLFRGHSPPKGQLEPVRNR